MMVQSLPRAFSATEPVDCELNAIGLRCPMPLLKAKQAIQGLPVGGTLRVKATDPGSRRDFQVWSAQAGHVLLACTDDDGIFTYVLRKQQLGDKAGGEASG